MTTQAYVRTRISPEIKEEATHVLADIGINMSDFLRIAVTMVAKQKALPFPIQRIPNQVTMEAMREAKKAMKMRFDNVDDLINDIEKKRSK